MKEQGNLWENILDFVVKHYKEDTFDTQKAFKKFQQLSDYGNYARQRTLRLYKAVGIAASILLILGIGLLWNKGHETELTSFSTVDSTRTWALADGTELTLAPHSKVTYNIEHYRSQRELNLEGRAYFMVKHDPNHPFTVNTHYGSVEDLGTSFQVSTCLGRRTSVLVTEGSVKFFIHDSKDGVILTRGMKGTIQAGTEHPIVSYGDINETAWATGIFKFNNTPILQALQTVSKCYQVDLSASDTTRSISGTFKADNIDEVIDILETTLNITIYRRGERK